MITIKDKFGDEKISDLDYTSLNALYSPAVIKASIESTADLDIRFPLISSNRAWTYGDAGTYDISEVASPLVYSELFPAVKVSKIFEFIGAYFGLTFSGLFLTDKRFTNMYTWFKNKKDVNLFIQPEPITFDNGFGDMFVDNQVLIQTIDPNTLTAPSGYSLLQTSAFSFNTENAWQTIDFYHSCDTTGVTYYIDIKKQYVGSSNAPSWVVVQPFTNLAAGPQDPVTLTIPNNTANHNYTVQLRCAEAITIYDTDIKHTFKVKYQNDTPLAVPTYDYVEEATILGTANMDEPYSLTSYLDIQALAPDIKVSDYFTGILNTFNLTCFPLQDGTFQIEPLQDWYSY